MVVCLKSDSISCNLSLPPAPLSPGPLPLAPLSFAPLPLAPLPLAFWYPLDTMIDAEMNETSRMGLTLQGYDQVIALSQTNINQTLKRYFKIDEAAMSHFDVKIGPEEEDPDYSLTGTIEPPTIELIDADKADQAIYTIKFKKNSKYSYWGPDPKDRRLPQIKSEVSAEGWTLAFFVNFGLQKCEHMPADLYTIVMKAGSYSVEQLVIIFGTADLIDFNWTLSKFPGLKDPSAQLDARTKMSDFINKWLMSLKSAEPGKSHNVLGYSVKLDVEGDQSRQQLLAKIGNTPPSFPPNKVQFQTIANKPNANAKGDPANPYNAFLFTEMCGIPGITDSRPLPQNDLQWSGNWFYGAIGGTLAMSSTIFLKEFVGKLVEPIHQEYSGFADKLAKRQTWDAEARINRVRKNVKFLGDWVQGQWYAVGNQWVLESESRNTHSEIPWVDGGKSFTVQVIVQAVMKSALRPIPGTGKFHIEQALQIVTKWSNFSVQYAFDATSTFDWTYVVQLASVGSTGKLESRVTFQRNERPVLTSTITARGVLVMGIGSNQTEEEKRQWDEYQAILKNTIQNKLPDETDFTGKINEGLNGQSKFIFPGGGTFDMSDPVFSNAGDLLLGLVYREGKI